MNSASTHKNPDFWIFGLFFFLYFFIMATCFPFLPVWLSDVVGLSKTDTGIVFHVFLCLPSVSSHCLGSYQIARD